MQEPTPEQLQQCKKLVEEKPPYLDANNKYAQWLKKENDKIEAEKVSAEDEVRKTNEKINAQRLMHVELTQSIDSQERKLNDLKDELKELKEILSNKDNKIFNTKIQKVERTQNITEEQIAQIRKSLNSCASQLQNNKVLNDDDVNNLKKSEAQVKKYIVEIEQDVETLQASAVSVMEEASIFVDKINQAYDSLIVEYVDLKSKIEEHSEILNIVAFLFSGEKTLADCINAVNNAQKQLEKLENTMRQFVILDSDQPLKKYEKQLESIENARTCLRKLSQNYELIGKQIEKDYLPLNQTSESELKQRREERIEKFNKKLAVSSKQPVLETGETTQPEQITEKTSKSAQKNKVDNETELSAKDKKFARMLAGKISPFPIEYVESRLAKIFESNISFIMPQFIFSETSYSADAMVSAICLDLGKNNFTRETVNAIRFAFLENLYEQSENKDGRIYSLNSKQAREVYEKIQKGAKEFDVRTDNGTLHIKLNSEFDMQRLEETYKKYLGNVGNDSDNAQKALNYLLEFAPAQSGIKFYAQEHFSDKGLYYTQLVSEKAPKELKIAIFKDFW